MHKLKIESGIAVFLLFFGTAMIDALRHHTWLLTSVYVLLAVAFLLLAWNRRERTHQDA